MSAHTGAIGRPVNFILYPALQEPPPQQQGETINADKWAYPWSEPVRFRHIHASQIASGGVWNPQQPLPPLSPWFAHLAEPVREIQRLHAALNPFDAALVIQPPGSATLIQGWYTWLAEPVRELSGLKTIYQQWLAYHPRLLPTPNVTMTLSATETGDEAIFGLNIPTSSGGGTGSASVSIVEIPAMNQGAMSIREP